VRRVADELEIRLNDDARRRDWVATRLSEDSTAVAVTRLEISEGQVPSVVGMGLKDALWTIERLGLRVDFSGKGRVVNQFPEAGAAVRRGAVITITLR
jgi:cell division protein FtsI (penicillin-binding protein 3)